MDNAPSTEKPVNWLGDSTVCGAGTFSPVELVAHITKANRLVGILSTLLPTCDVSALDIDLTDREFPKVCVDIANNDHDDRPSMWVNVYLLALDKVEGLIGTSASEGARVS